MDSDLTANLSALSILNQSLLSEDSDDFSLTLTGSILNIPVWNGEVHSEVHSESSLEEDLPLQEKTKKKSKTPKHKNAAPISSEQLQAAYSQSRAQREQLRASPYHRRRPSSCGSRRQPAELKLSEAALSPRRGPAEAPLRVETAEILLRASKSMPDMAGWDFVSERNSPNVNQQAEPYESFLGDFPFDQLDMGMHPCSNEYHFKETTGFLPPTSPLLPQLTHKLVHFRSPQRGTEESGLTKQLEELRPFAQEVKRYSGVNMFPKETSPWSVTEKWWRTANDSVDEEINQGKDTSPQRTPMIFQRNSPRTLPSTTPDSGRLSSGRSGAQFKLLFKDTSQSPRLWGKDDSEGFHHIRSPDSESDTKSFSRVGSVTLPTNHTIHKVRMPRPVANSNSSLKSGARRVRRTSSIEEQANKENLNFNSFSSNKCQNHQRPRNIQGSPFSAVDAAAQVYIKPRKPCPATPGAKVNTNNYGTKSNRPPSSPLTKTKKTNTQKRRTSKQGTKSDPVKLFHEMQKNRAKARTAESKRSKRSKSWKGHTNLIPGFQRYSEDLRQQKRAVAELNKTKNLA